MGKVEEIIQAVIEEEGIQISPEDLKERTEFLRNYLKVFEELEPKDYFPSIEQIKETIAKLVEKNKGTLSDKEQADQRKMLEHILIEGKVPADAMGINKDTIEMIYNEGGRLYNNGKYQDALGFFRLIDLVLPNIPKFAFAIGACYQMLGKNRESIAWYLKCAYFDKESPIPYYHMADCLFKLKNYGAALGALASVLQRAGDDPKYEKICGKTKLMMEDAKKRMNENPPGKEDESTGKEDKV